MMISMISWNLGWCDAHSFRWCFVVIPAGDSVGQIFLWNGQCPVGFPKWILYGTQE